MDASVVIATRGRPRDLARCLAALSRQRTSRRFEVVVVDDGSSPPLSEDLLAPLRNARLLRAGGVGPAGARNVGLRAARGHLIVFTDDDTEPAPSWLESACAFLDAHADAVGVEGPVASPAFDYLYAHSLENSSPGAYWTCNVGYRREVLERLGGFSEDFPHPHCEDRELGFRAAGLGPIGFAEGMRIVHHPRRLRLRELIARARYAPSEIVLFRRHRERFGRERLLPARLYPLAMIVLAWLRRARADRRLLRSPRRALRFGVAALAQIAVVAAVTLAVRPHRAA